MNRRSLGKFLIRLFTLMLIGGFVGGFIGAWSSSFSGDTEEMVISFFESVRSLILNCAPVAAIVTQLLTFIPSLLFLNKAKREYEAWDHEDADYIANTENTISVGTTIINIGLITALTFFSVGVIHTSTMTHSISKDMGVVYGITPVIFIILEIGISLIQRALINLTKDINPEKAGEPMDFSFQKKWFKSCDEFERQVVYKSAYNAFRVTNILFISLICFFMLLSTIYPIGIAPILLTGFLAIIQNVVYTVSTMKYSYHRKGNL